MKTTQMNILEIQLLISTWTEFRNIMSSELNTSREMEENVTEGVFQDVVVSQKSFIPIFKTPNL